MELVRQACHNYLLCLGCYHSNCRLCALDFRMVAERRAPRGYMCLYHPVHLRPRETDPQLVAPMIESEMNDVNLEPVIVAKILPLKTMATDSRIGTFVLATLNA